MSTDHHEGGSVQPPPPSDPPRAWLACILSFAALFVAFGLAYSYGVFFSPITHEFGARSGEGAAIFSITSLLFFGLSCITGPLSDRLGPRPLLLAAGVLIGAGLAGAAQATELWQAYVAYGLGVGLGASCVFVPVVAAVGRWFRRRRTTALGIAVSGIGMGTLCVAPLSAWLIELHGWRTVYELYAIAAVLVLGLSGVLYPKPPRAPEGIDDSRPRWGGRRYLHLYVATLGLNAVMYVPFVHLPPAAETLGIDPLRAAGLVGIIGVASVVGRLAIGPLGDRFPLLTLYRGCYAVIALSFLLWTVAGDYPGLALFAVSLGVAYGGYIALTPAVLAHLFGLENLGRLLGVLYTAVGLGASAGPLLTGLGVDLLGNYTVVLLVLHAVGLLSLLATLPVRSGEADGQPAAEQGH